jgi:hypothetical protein
MASGWPAVGADDLHAEDQMRRGLGWWWDRLMFREKWYYWHVFLSQMRGPTLYETAKTLAEDPEIGDGRIFYKPKARRVKNILREFKCD